MFEDLITVCYPGGACGNAIAYMLSLSPEVWQDWRSDPAYRDPVDGNGAVHCIPSRLGTLDRSSGAMTSRDVIEVCERFGHAYRPGNPVPDQVGEWYDLTKGAVVAFSPARLLSTVEPGRKSVHAAHATGEVMRSLYPGSRVISVHGDTRIMIRNFASKFALENDPTDPDLGTHIDAEFIRQGIPPSRRNRKLWLSRVLRKNELFNKINENDDLSHRVEFTAMFNRETSGDVYHAMVEFAGLTPNWTAAKDFIIFYNQRQNCRDSCKVD